MSKRKVSQLNDLDNCLDSKTFKSNESTIIKNKELNEKLLVAVNSGSSVIDLIESGADLNYQNSFGKRAIDLAWENNHYNIVLELLKADSEFPATFDAQICKNIKKFVDERTNLHELIKKGDLSEIKKFVSCNESKFYLNPSNKSACLTAIENKQFEIFAYLQSQNVCFKDKNESNCINNLDKNSKTSIRDLKRRYFHSIRNSHLFYLQSKSKIEGKINSAQNFESIANYFRELDKINEISTILKVCQYVDNLSIVFDFNKENISCIDLTASINVKGRTYYSDNYIYIGAKTDEKSLLGTLAHELTHLAMQTVFKNNSNPYFSNNSQKESEFKEIIQLLRNRSVVNDIIKWVFTAGYDESRWAAELIVRVPHILAYHDQEIGSLILNKQAKKLIDYFNSSVLPEFNKFIENSFDLKPRENIQLLNLSFVREIKDLKIQLKKNIKLDCMNSENFIILKSNNITLVSADVLSKLEKSKRFNEYFLFIRFDFYLKHSQDILNVFNSHCKLLVITFFQEPDNNSLENLHQLNQVLKNKKLIFIFKENFKTKNLKRYFEVNFVKLLEYSINDLTSDYQSILLEKKVLFQGIEMSLNELITLEDNLDKLIEPEAFDKLINNQTIIIGKEITISDEIKNFYINRTINLPIIDSAILKDSQINCAISNISEPELRSLVPDEHLSRHFILDSEELELKILSESNNSNTHWFKWSNNELIWIKSKGEINGLRKYIKKNSIKQKEEILVQENERDILFITNRAGMGKSTFLTKISYDLKSKNRSSWIIKLNLIDFTQQFSHIQSNEDLKEILKNKTDLDSFIDYFIENFFKFESNLEKKLLKYYFENRTKTVIILLDGFDEISPLYEDIVIDFMNQIKSIATKIWITTRHITQKRLEIELNALSFNLKPFNKDEQISFLVKKWNHNISDQLDEAFLIDRAENLIENMSDNDFSDSDQIFTSNPLHLNMLADVYKDNNGFSFSLSELYDKFIKKKFDIYCTEKKKEDLTNPGVLNDNKILYNSLLERHKQFAICFLFKELENRIEMRDNANILFDLLMSLEDRLNSRFLRPKILENIFTEVELEGISSLQIKEKTGIIDFIDNQFRFIHRTFAEYFVSIYFIENLEKNNIQNILIEYVLLEYEFAVVRKFIDSKVKNKTNNFNFSNFETEKYFKSAHGAAFEGNEQIVRFLVDSLNESQKEELFNSRYSLDSENESYNYNILLNAACNGNFSIVEYLIEKGYDVNKDLKYIMEQVKENIEFNENEFLNFIVSQNFININIQDEDGETLAHYFSKREDIEMLEFLKTNKIDFSIKNKYGFTAIESIVKTYYNILERPSLSDMKQSYDFLLPDTNYLSLEVKIMLSIHFQDLEKLNEYLSDESIDLNKIVKNYGPFSFKACRNGNLEIVKILRNKGCDLKKKWKILNDYKYAYSLESDPEYEYNTLEVADTNNFDLLNFLIDEIQCEITPFMIKKSIKDSEITLLKLLLEKNADPNCLVEDRMTPLLYLVNFTLTFDIVCNCQKIEMLVNKGADLLCNDGKLGNPLHIAAFKDNCDYIKTLLKVAIETNKLKELLEPFSGKNAFQIATMNLNNKAAKILKDFYADTNQPFVYEYISDELIKVNKKAFENIFLNGIDSYNDTIRERVRNFQLENY